MSEKINLGVHCSISGGLENAISSAETLGIDTFQIFTKNQRQWRERIIPEPDATNFKQKMANAGIQLACSHTSYLINLASTDDAIRTNSILALSAELIRCYALGLTYTVMHPGSNKLLGNEGAIAKVAEGLIVVLNHTYEYSASVLLENTAGQGSTLGGKFSDIEKIFQIVNSERLGMCFDTCHAFAAGYDIRTQTGIEAALGEIDDLFGIERIKVFHLNDSKGTLGSRLDRHAHIGQGNLGLEPFRYLMRNFKHIPKILETDKADDMDEKNLAKLRELA